MRDLLLRFLLVLSVLCAATPVFAIWPLPSYSTYPCNTAVNPPSNCSSQGGNPLIHGQTNLSQRSPHSTCTPDSTFGICSGTGCESTAGWCRHPEFPAPPTAQILTINDRTYVLFHIEYDFPNNYCQISPSGDIAMWPIIFNDFHQTRLVIQDNSQRELAVSYAVFEHGLWEPLIPVCGFPTSFIINLENKCNQNLTNSFSLSVNPDDNTPSSCRLDRTCPNCNYFANPPGHTGDPINLGSGDITVNVPLFSIDGAPQPLALTVNYHSSKSGNRPLVSEPMGEGWSHNFNTTLRRIDSAGQFLYRLGSDGAESYFTRVSATQWTSSGPGELRETATLDTTGTRLQTKDLNGTVTSYDAQSGVWLSTVDRWGNSISGTYSGGQLTAIADSEGRQFQLSYSGSKLAQITLPGGGSWRFGYTGSELSQIFDPLHTGATAWRTLEYQADSRGSSRLLTAIRDDAGKLLEGHTYDSQDRGTSSFSENNRDLVTVQFDSGRPDRTMVTHSIDGATTAQATLDFIYQRGRFLPLQVTGTCLSCPGGSNDTQAYDFDQSNFARSFTDGNGHITRYEYDVNGNVTRRTEAAGTALERVTAYEYGYNAWPKFVTKTTESSAAKPGAQHVTTRSWNADETVLTVTESGWLRPTDTAPTTYVTVSTFDARHRLISFDGPRTDVSDVTTRTYYPDNDANALRRGRPQRATDPAGLVTTYDDYDVYGTARSSTDPNGVVTLTQTDGRGRTTARIVQAVASDPREGSDYTTAMSYDGRDRLLRMTFPAGNAIRYAYEDGTSRATDTIRVDASGRDVERKHLTLNQIGDVLREEDQRCNVPAAPCAAWTTTHSVDFVYDSRNRLSRRVQADGAALVYAYDPDGRVHSTQDENHAAANTTNGYDALDRLQSVTQTLGSGAAVTQFGYDAQDNVTRFVDANGNVTTSVYDDFHRLQTQTSPASGTSSYTYDPAGNLVSSTNGNGAATARTYDAANRVLSATSSRSGTTAEVVSWTYDGAAAGNYGKGRVASVSDPTGSLSYAYERRGLVRGETHNVQGNTYSIGYGYDSNGNRSAITYPSGRVVSYTFDFADRPLSAASGGNTFVGNASYLPFGPLSGLTYGNGTAKSVLYDNRYRVAENRLTGPAGVIADYQYGADPVGNITSIHDLVDPSFNRDFRYDDLYRLTSANTGQALWGTGSYSYDAMGNMLTMSMGSSRQSSFAYDGTSPRLSSVTENGAARPVAYDAAGNEAAVGAASYAYSPRNLLSAADGLGYAYDWRGLRTITTVSSALGTLTGNVVGASGGAPIGGATVTVDGTLNSTTTDAGGNFSLNQGSGTFTVTVARQGFVAETTTAFTLGVGATVSVGTVKLTVAPSVISGTVVSSLGFPLGGASVAIGSAGGTTDGAGKFSVTVPAGTYTASISAPGYTPQTTASFTTAPGDQRSLGTISLAAIPATISGRVVSSTGGAVAGATVTANGTPLGASAQARVAASAFTQSTTTDGSGNFTLSLPAGTYTLTITRSGFADAVTGAVNVGPGAAYAAGNVTIDPLGTITGLVVAKTTGNPIAGATVAIVGSLNTTTTDAAGRFTAQQPAGSYAVQVTATGFAQVTTDFFALAPGASHDTGTLELPPVALSVYVGYADDLRPSSNFPVPWAGSPNVVYIGTPSPLDAGAIRLDNNTDAAMNVDSVSVDLGRPGPTFNLWGSFAVPAHGTVILTQTQQFNFDTSDFAITACDQAPLANDPRVPRVTINMGGNATTYYDTGHILDTGGYDLACKANESLQWRLIGTTGINSNGDFLLSPPTGTAALGTNYTVTATATDANGQPLRNVNVTFRVISGPNIGRTGTSATNANGQATFSYAGTAAGSDTLQATITNASGGSLTSNPVSVTWPAFSNVEVFVGYADDLRPAPAFPIPWQGSPNVVFIGNRAPEWDSGAVRIDNVTDSTVHVDRVSVDLQRPGPVFSLWGSFDIPPHFSAILAQTNGENFDTSDFALVGCHGTISPTDPRIPKITITINGQTASYLDTGHILDTFGYDVACDNRNESLQWRPVGSSSTTDTGRLTLLPLTTTTIVGSTYTATAVATDAGNEPMPNVPIDFRVVTGPNTGKTGRVTTNASGVAAFSYASTVTGTDTVRASITGSTGGVLNSNDVKSIWVSTAAVSLAPPAATNLTGGIYNAVATVTDGASAPLANLNVTFRITSGPNAGKTGTGITAANGTANFAYTSSATGTDTIVASVIGAGGAQIQSNSVTATWTAPVAIALAPPTATQTLGSTYTATATVTSGSSPAAGAAVTFTVLSGPNAPRTASATTNASGQATFSYSGAALGTDVVLASTGSVSSNQVLVRWTNVPTTLTFLGSFVAEYNDPASFSARLTESLTGTPLAGRTISFALGAQTAAGTTDASGTARVTITPSGVPGPTPMAVSFAAAGAYTASTATAFVSVVRDETAIRYTGKSVVANGVAQTVSAVLTDPDGGAPLPGKTVTFTIGSVSVSAVSGADGTATAAITVPPSLGTGPIRMAVAFAGDAFYVPADTSVPVILFAPSSFVVWGGNATPPRVGEKVNFWGSQWPKQVTGGDYDEKADFKGFATLAAPPLAQICEPAARQNGTPRLDDRCWTSRTGDTDPPAQLDRYIGIIVSTSIAKQQSTIYGNIAATVVVRVEPIPQYGSDPGLPGFGTIVAVIDDGAGLFPHAAAAPAPSESAYFFRHVTRPRRTFETQLVSLLVSDDEDDDSWLALAGFSPAATYVNALRPAPLTVPANSKRYSFYSPDSQLLAETGLVTGGAPAIGYEYIWFAGQPVAQVDLTTHWTFTDHLGTPILQTDSAGQIWWRAEYEPFGAVYALRSPDQHQPLRLPGEEAEQLNLGANGVTERLYGVTRWYRSAWGRYTQPEIGFYNVAGDNPIGAALPVPGSAVPALPNEITADPADTAAKTVCDGNNCFKWVWVKKPPCAEECYIKHEEDHIRWFQQNRPEACVRRAKGDNPFQTGNDQAQTECRGFRISQKCLEMWRLKVQMGGTTQDCKVSVQTGATKHKQKADAFCAQAGTN